MRSRAVLLTAVLCLAAGPATRPTGSTDQRIDGLLAPGPSEGKVIPLPPGGAIDRTSGHGAVAPGARPMRLVREGTHLFNRSGRLNHTPDGQTAVFTFDADGKTMGDPPMIILPNLKLGSMEGQVAGLQKDVKFRVSGTVTEYKGRNYLLLDNVVVVQDFDSEF